MEQVGIQMFKHKRLNELSGGQRQKAYLAMALAGQAEILLLDEPTTYLDIQYQAELFELIKRQKELGKTIVAVLHDIDYALRLADWVLLLKDGKLIMQGIPGQIWESGAIAQVFQVKTGSTIDEKGGIHYYFG